MAAELMLPAGFLLAIIPVALAIPNGMPRAMRINFILAIDLTGAFAVYLNTAPGRKELAFMLSAAAVCFLILASTGPVRWFSAISILGASSVLTLGVRAAADRRSQPAFWYSAFFLHGWIVLVLAMNLAARMLPRTLDRTLYAFDGVLGLQPSFLLARLIVPHPVLSGLVGIQYGLLSGIIACVHVWRVRRRVPGPSIIAISACMLAAGYVLYFLVPGTGPRYAFPEQFPWSFPTVAGGPIFAQGAFRNAMPSLHLALALLIWWQSRGMPAVLRTMAALFLLATAFSTLAAGEHYFVDLVVAVPFSVAIHATWSPAAPWGMKAASVITGVALTAVWVAALRLGPPDMFTSRVLAWALVGVTVALPLLLEARLARFQPQRS